MTNDTIVDDITFLLLPGLEGTGELFRPFVEAAPPGATCHVVGYPDDPSWGYREHADFVLREHVPDGPFVVVGESFSGPVAVSVGAACPDGLRGVVLVNSFVVRPSWNAFSRLPWERVLSRPVPRWVVGWHLVGWDRADDLLPVIRAANRKMSGATKAARLRAVFAVDVRDDLRRIEAPTLYLRGTRDRLVPGWCVRQAELARPDLRVARFIGPHLLLQVRPERCWEAIGSML